MLTDNRLQQEACIGKATWREFNPVPLAAQDHMMIATDEIFGPVQSILKFSSIEEVSTAVMAVFAITPSVQDHQLHLLWIEAFANVHAAKDIRVVRALLCLSVTQRPDSSAGAEACEPEPVWAGVRRVGQGRGCGQRPVARPQGRHRLGQLLCALFLTLSPVTVR